MGRHELRAESRHSHSPTGHGGIAVCSQGSSQLSSSALWTTWNSYRQAEPSPSCSYLRRHCHHQSTPSPLVLSWTVLNLPQARCYFTSESRQVPCETVFMCVFCYHPLPYLSEGLSLNLLIRELQGFIPPPPQS